MTKFGFLSVLEEGMDKHFTFDHAIDRSKEDHAIEVTSILETQNQSAVETVNDQGEIGNDNVTFENYMLFYNQTKSKVDEGNYLVTIPLDAERSFSRELLAYFAETLDDVATEGLGDLVDFLTDESAADFTLE